MKDYERISNMHCSPQMKTRYENIEEGKEECTKKPGCSMLFDAGDNDNTVVLCSDPAEMKNSSIGSVLYRQIPGD